ncbi:hypothetical protein [Paenibacillus methanolicus]|uniref:Uncharacterized protein n=1 Tax=Paenibacillus methanolicus TaxID=582686 RepID=A0A5S5C0P9_9BACL|nr:hypothetical protein [Paenibacillus methanolicus]TYP72032.1 hypothetical protein BCM02_109311 [Paenibacillus methanolicus]
MGYTVQYIPLHKIKAGLSAKTTKRGKELHKVAQDCMQLLVVRKSRKDGGYVILSGNTHLDYYKRFTKKNAVPCLVDEGKIATAWAALVDRYRKRHRPQDLPYANADRIAGNGLAIIRSYLKQDARFKKLSRREQLRVLRLGWQYKKTTIRAMKAKVDELMKR